MLQTHFLLPSHEIKVLSKRTDLNEEKSIVHFLPSEGSWKKKLNSTEYFFSCLFPSGALYFNGKICIERFVEAMERTLEDFHFMFFKFYLENNDLYVGYTNNNRHNYCVQLEIETLSSEINLNNFESILPNKVDERIKFGATADLANLPISAFKLTILKNGFIISYYLNHAFFDQSSVVYFLSYLAQTYNYQGKLLDLKKPKLANLDLIDTKQNFNFKGRTDLREKGLTLMGFMHLVRKGDYSEYIAQFGDLITVDIHFNQETINSIKYNKNISSNDIIHSILLKIQSLNPNIKKDNSFRLGYPCNMRKQCGLGNEIIGNVISHDKLVLNIEFIRDSSILDLAISNRQNVSGITVEKFMQELNWYRYFQEQREISLDYMPIFDFLSCRVTNWTSFNYDNIAFDNITPIKLGAPCYAKFGVNVVSQQNKNMTKSLKTTVCIPSHTLTHVKNLGKSTQLFEIKERHY